MTRKSWNLFKIVVLLGSCSGFIDFRYASGFLLGAIASIVLYKRAERYADSVIYQNQASTPQSILNFVNSYAIMAIVLIVAALLPNYLNIFAAAIGMMAIKIAVIIEALTTGKEEGNADKSTS